jgi:hypothetical protein
MQNTCTEIKKINFVDLPCFDLMPNLLKEAGKPYRSLGMMFKDFAQPLTNCIEEEFNRGLIKVTHSYMGIPVRSELINNNLKESISEYFSDYFKTRAFKPTIYRTHPTALPSAQTLDNINPKEYWISELWHSDNEPNNVTRLIIYLDDVIDDGDSPFEYYDDPKNKICEYNYANNKIDGGWKKSRFFNLDEDKKIKVYGPKYSSFIFHPNMIHKANFARTKKRDVISINLHHLTK